MDLLNVMDAGYRADYRELLDARLAQFAAELRLEMGVLRAQLRGEMKALRDELRGEMRALRDEVRGEVDALRRELRGEMKSLREEVTVRLKSQEVRLIRWMVGLWATSTLVLLGALMTLRAG